MPRTTVTVTCRAVPELTKPGGWCPACLVPSIVSVPVLVEFDGQPRGVSLVRFCSDCAMDMPT